MKSNLLRSVQEHPQHALSPSIDFFRVIQVLLSRWYWILACILVSIGVGLLFVKLAKSRYVAEATLEYLDKRSVMDDIYAAGTDHFFNSGISGYVAEKYKIASTEVISNAIVETRDFFHFHRIKDFRKIDCYPFIPLETEILYFNENEYTAGEFHFSEDLILSYHSEDIITEIEYENEEIVQVKGLIFKVLKVNTEPGYNYVFEYAANPKRLKEIKERLQLKELSDHNQVMKLSFKHHNQQFAADFLYQLLKSYEHYDLKEKQVSTDLTLGFIKGKLKEMQDSLNIAGEALKSFRERTQLSEPENEIRELGLQVRTLEDQKKKLLLEKEFIDQLFQNADTSISAVIDYLPLGWDDQADKVLVGLLNQFNQLVVKRKEILATQLPAAVEARNNEIHIQQTRKQLIENLRFQRIKNNRSLDFVQDQLEHLHSRVIALPAYVQDFQSLKGSYQINEQIYSLLINKQLEVALTKSGIIPSFKVIDIHMVEKLFPKKIQTLVFFAFAGFFFGCLLVMAKRKMHNRFYRFDDIALLEQVKFGGIIPHYYQHLQGKVQDLILLGKDRSAFSESFSNIRMQVGLTDGKKGKIIVITSHGAGDGKSFIGLNLALSFARMDSKVLMVDADLRMPSQDKYFDIYNQTGLKEYLEDPGIELKKIIRKTAIPGLDYISAGQKTSFNSTELIGGHNLKPLLEKLKNEYDILIFDTPPVGLLTDAISIMQQADNIFYVVRWLFSDDTAGVHAELLCKQYGFQNMSLLVNDYYYDGLYLPLINEYSEFGLPARYNSQSGGNGYYLTEKKKPSRWFFRH